MSYFFNLANAGVKRRHRPDNFLFSKLPGPFSDAFDKRPRLVSGAGRPARHTETPPKCITANKNTCERVARGLRQADSELSGRLVLKNANDECFTLSHLNKHLQDEKKHLTKKQLCPNIFEWRVPAEYLFYPIAVASGPTGKSLTVQGETVVQTACIPKRPACPEDTATKRFVLQRMIKSLGGNANADTFYVQYRLNRQDCASVPSSDSRDSPWTICGQAFRVTESPGNVNNRMARVNFQPVQAFV